MAKESGNSSGEVMIRRQRVGRRTGSLESGSGSGGLGQCFKKVCSRSYGKEKSPSEVDLETFLFFSNCL